MGNKIAVTDSGVHKIGKKIFLTDENLVHRKSKKAFLTKDGVHRLVFSSGTVWNKYSCEEISETVGYTEVDSTDSTSIGDTLTATYYRIVYSSEYYFNENAGFVGIGGGYVTSADEVDSISGYMVDSEAVWAITSVELLQASPLRAEITLECVALCSPVTEDSYVQGSIYYDSFEVEDGELPENGGLIAGSANDSYCVLNVDDNYYYYVRGE